MAGHEPTSCDTRPSVPERHRAEGVLQARDAYLQRTGLVTKQRCQPATSGMDGLPLTTGRVDHELCSDQPGYRPVPVFLAPTTATAQASYSAEYEAYAMQRSTEKDRLPEENDAGFQGTKSGSLRSTAELA
ncbi:MAG: hypothetical protein M1823_004270 [Watsoniomyces obsoletus]|nr:MAG: hypothetical protein M1823_004270 [Watsoniomyces obsoletus]